MNTISLLLITLIFAIPTTQIAMKKSLKEHTVRWDVLSNKSTAHYKRLPDKSSVIKESFQLDPLIESSEEHEKTTLLEKLITDDNYTIKAVHDASIFTLLPQEIFIHILLNLDLKDFLTLLKTDTIRKALCSEHIIERFLLEKRYNNDLLRNSPKYLNFFPIENQAAILDLNMLLITAASAGYTEDFHVLLNTEPILNYILEGTRTHVALSTAVTEEQIGIVKQLISHKIIKRQFSQEELTKISELSESYAIKKLLKKKSVKKKTSNKIRSLIGVQI